jgi:hypothetical protein
MIVAMDAVRPDYSAFYEYFIDGDKTLLDINLPIENLLKKLYYKEDKNKIIKLTEAINLQFRKNAIVLPLYQEVRNFYYPRKIKNLEIGQDFLEYPTIAEINL